jgi:hypothetical protein
MTIQVTTKLTLHLKIKRKLLSHVYLELLYIEGCLLDYVMYQPHFKDACLLYLVIWLNIFLKFSWIIFLLESCPKLEKKYQFMITNDIVLDHILL